MTLRWGQLGQGLLAPSGTSHQVEECSRLLGLFCLPLRPQPQTSLCKVNLVFLSWHGALVPVRGWGRASHPDPSSLSSLVSFRHVPLQPCPPRGVMGPGTKRALSVLLRGRDRQTNPEWQQGETWGRDSGGLGTES